MNETYYFAMGFVSNRVILWARVRTIMMRIFIPFYLLMALLIGALWFCDPIVAAKMTMNIPLIIILPPTSTFLGLWLLIKTGKVLNKDLQSEDTDLAFALETNVDSILHRFRGRELLIKNNVQHLKEKSHLFNDGFWHILFVDGKVAKIPVDLLTANQSQSISKRSELADVLAANKDKVRKALEAHLKMALHADGRDRQ